ncbi:hypothetical protein BSKO_13418 [Bryopsis sp. KO-2023]|nr:hypothetical protein BSKO_13418 [Bryopsis sp. KO-2023]
MKAPLSLAILSVLLLFTDAQRLDLLGGGTGFGRSSVVTPTSQGQTSGAPTSSIFASTAEAISQRRISPAPAIAGTSSTPAPITTSVPKPSTPAPVTTSAPEPDIPEPNTPAPVTTSAPEPDIPEPNTPTTVTTSAPEPDIPEPNTPAPPPVTTSAPEPYTFEPSIPAPPPETEPVLNGASTPPPASGGVPGGTNPPIAPVVQETQAPQAVVQRPRPMLFDLLPEREPSPEVVPAPVQEPVPAPVPVVPAPVPVVQPVPVVTTLIPVVQPDPQLVQVLTISDILGQAGAPGQGGAQNGFFPSDAPFSTAAQPQGQGQGQGQGGQGQENNEGQGNSNGNNGNQGNGGQGGNNALIKPYVVSLRRRSDLGYFCAGVLIRRRHVLTAAHCVDSSLPGGDTQPEVVIGSARLSQTSGPDIQVVSTDSVTLHPGTSGGKPDLAILKLARRANQGPIRLPNSADFLPNGGENVVGIGWGRTSRQSAFSDLVQFFRTTFVPRDTCSQSLNRDIPDFNLCVGGEGGSSCSGDDGGPIVAERNPDLLVGIVGSQHACGEPMIDVHNNVATSIDWIRETIRNT